MTMIVGYAPDERGKAALHLAGMLARSAEEDLVVCSVVPAPWIPGMAKIDAEYQAQLDDAADAALKLARTNLPADVSATFGAALRVVSFAVWSRPAYTTRLGTDTEDEVWSEWTATMEESANVALKQVGELSAAPRTIEAVIGRGHSWADAMDDLEWDEGDVLVIGSSDIGPVAQVFLGSRASKILRHSPVPWWWSHAAGPRSSPSRQRNGSQADEVAFEERGTDAPR